MSSSNSSSVILSEELFINTMMINIGLKELKLFHEKTEKSWERANSLVEVEIKRLTEMGHDDAGEWYGQEMHYNDRYANIHRESLVITINNFVENSLNILCKEFSKYLDSKVKLNDIAGKGIRRAITYLKKVANINFSFMGEEMSYLFNFNKLRNNIVHAGGLLPSNDNDDLIKFIQINEYLSGEKGSQVLLSPAFIDQALGVFVNLFEKIAQEINTSPQSSTLPK